MNDIAENLHKKTILICVGKAERGFSMQTILERMGMKAILCTSLYEISQSLQQEMPHLVVTESLLSDGDAGTVFDKVKSNPLFQNVPVLACIMKKTPQELAPLKGRKFSGFIMGNSDPRTFAAKVKQTIDQEAAHSPYFVAASEYSKDISMVMSVPARALGRHDEQVIFASDLNLDSESAMIALPQTDKMDPVLMRMPTSLKQEEEYYNLFPISRLKGKGLTWIRNLPCVELGNKETEVKRRVLFFDPNQERGYQYREVLSGYNIELDVSSSLSMACAQLGRSSEYDAVFLYELTNDASGIAWKKAYSELADASKPIVLIGTTSTSMRSTETQRYIHKPFGLGLLIEALEACFVQPEDISGSVSRGDLAHQDVSLQAPAKFIGLDESGGIAELKFPLPIGSKVEMNHPLIRQLLGDDQTQFRISAVGLPKDKAHTWQIRFETVASGSSQQKHWEKICQKLQQMQPQIQEEEAA